jgi:precorrin-3B synthase
VDDAAQFDRRRFAGGVMNHFAIKGWCPGALRPMRSGDGLVVRIRPHGGRLSPAQASALAELAARFGSGLIDATNRANLQIRGVGDENHAPLIAELARLGLLDADADLEALRNIVVAPFWVAGDDTSSLAAELGLALAARRLALPGKFGFAVDCGISRALVEASADIRIERDQAGGLLVRADGARKGCPAARSDAVRVALALAEWFIASGGANNGRGRMAAHLSAGATIPEVLAGRVTPGRIMPPPRPGRQAGGALVALAFGQIKAATLRVLAEAADGLRLTPWRMIFAEGLGEMPDGDGIVTEAGDPILRVVACAGAPACRQAHAETRALAAALAPHLAGDARLHVSGCIKGCAQPGPAPITLVATAHGFDLIRDGSARDAPVMRGLDVNSLLADPSVLRRIF